ncbi:HalOD1 output domain-containing protein [Natronosalvus vescus]|uniref:HalOD1 output domain-containing protein n=1 Tax=Natronosalvus vescus TaxID=2953881 RepID=UPI002090F012|nr:HalOD1 output domain-containing protein [Natronosalvus vescus]
MTAPSSPQVNAADSGVPNTTYFTHDWTDADDLTTDVVMAVAEMTGKDETEIECVHDRLNPESLNTLFSQTETERYTPDSLIMFSLEGCSITVYSSGLVVVQGE